MLGSSPLCFLFLSGKLLSAVADTGCVETSVLVSEETVESLSFKSSGIGKVGHLTKWGHGLLSITWVSSTETGGNCVGHVCFSLSLEAGCGASTVVLEAAGEGSEETSSFLVGLLKQHAVIVALDLHWLSSLLLLLLHHGLLMNDGLLLLHIYGLDGLLDILNMFSLLLIVRSRGGISSANVVQALRVVGRH